LALVVPESVAWAEIEACVRKTLGDRLQSTVLFDVYRGAGLAESSKSLAIGLILHEYSRTLNDLEIETSISQVLASLAKDCQAVLRG
jgi:phenylalanyl-tRNA synthetase beta chain